MFQNSLFANDPFFSSYMESMRHMEHSMDAMMTNLMDPYGFYGGPRQPAIGYDGYNRDYDRRGERQNSRQLQQLAQQRQRHPMEMGMYNNLFGGFGMMPNMHNMLQQQMVQAQTDPNSSYYSQSSVMSYQNTGDGRPRIYQASTSQGQANGVKEVRKSIRDSAQGVEKMTVAREIGEKSQVVTKQRNANTGAIEEDKELVNLDEEEEDQFTHEFRQRTSQSLVQPHQSGHMMIGHIPDVHRQEPLALEAPRHDPRRPKMDSRHVSQDMPRRDRAAGVRHNGWGKKASPKKQKTVRF